MREPNHDPLLYRKAAATFLGLINHHTLAVWDRTEGYDLQSIKLGHLFIITTSIISISFKVLI
jgi:hypothetical protein